MLDLVLFYGLRKSFENFWMDDPGEYLHGIDNAGGWPIDDVIIKGENTVVLDCIDCRPTWTLHNTLNRHPIDCVTQQDEVGVLVDHFFGGDRGER